MFLKVSSGDRFDQGNSNLGLSLRDWVKFETSEMVGLVGRGAREDIPQE